MASPGWLDIHGHFYLPLKSPQEGDQIVEAWRKNDFLITEAPHFNAEVTIAFHDRTGIAMQMLSYLPTDLKRLQAANDYAASIVAKHPTRFGQLLALPTDNVNACFEEMKRTTNGHYKIPPDGFAASTVYNGVGLGTDTLHPLWQDLNNRHATIFVHPNAYAPGTDGRPSPLIDVAFDTARTIVDMTYKRVFSKYPNINFVFSHCGGALPVLTGRLTLLGAESWVPNTNRVSSKEIRAQLESLWFDCAATAETGLEPAAKVAGIEKVVYGADCGVPCSTESTIEINRGHVRDISRALSGDAELVGGNGWKLFPAARKRAFGGS